MDMTEALRRTGSDFEIIFRDHEVDRIRAAADFPT
jgi:hypothetical protein